MIWKSILERDAKCTFREPLSRASYREMWIRHWPYWFLTQYVIWYPDDPRGFVHLALFNKATCNIIFLKMEAVDSCLNWQLTIDGQRLDCPDINMTSTIQELELSGYTGQSSFLERISQKTVWSDWWYHKQEVFLRPTTHVSDDSAALWPSVSLPTPLKTKSEASASYGL